MISSAQKKLKHVEFGWDGQKLGILRWIKTNAPDGEPDVYPESLSLNKIEMMSLVRFTLRILQYYHPAPRGGVLHGKKN